MLQNSPTLIPTPKFHHQIIQSDAIVKLDTTIDNILVDVTKVTSFQPPIWDFENYNLVCNIKKN